MADDGGATVSLDAQLIGNATLNVLTGDDADTLFIKQLSRPTQVSTGRGNDAIQVGSDAGRLNLIAANLRLTAGEDWDTLTLNASGASSEGVSGVLGSSSVVEFTENVSGFELQGLLDYAAFESVNLHLGTGADTVQILRVGDDLTASVFGHGGADQFVVGDATKGLDEIQGRVNVDGGEGLDHLLVNDLATAVLKMGLLTERSLTGLGMGTAAEGVRYDELESLTLDLESAAAGQYQLAITSLAIPTHVQLGDGDDTVLVGDSLFRITADLTVAGGAEQTQGDAFFIASSLSTNLLLSDSSIAAVDMPGTITLADFETESVTLSNAPDTVTVTGTGAALTLNLLDGADQAIIESASHPTTINLGDDSDNDQAIVNMALASVAVFGTNAAADSLVIDTALRSARQPSRLPMEQAPNRRSSPARRRVRSSV